MHREVHDELFGFTTIDDRAAFDADTPNNPYQKRAILERSGEFNDRTPRAIRARSHVDGEVDDRLAIRLLRWRGRYEQLVDRSAYVRRDLRNRSQNPGWSHSDGAGRHVDASVGAFACVPSQHSQSCAGFSECQHVAVVLAVVVAQQHDGWGPTAAMGARFRHGLHAMRRKLGAGSEHLAPNAVDQLTSLDNLNSLQGVEAGETGADDEHTKIVGPLGRCQRRGKVPSHSLDVARFASDGSDSGCLEINEKVAVIDSAERNEGGRERLPVGRQ
ncbi:MAG: hypothetical protein ACLGHT_08260 [Acidimicrobiia bacterium]